MPDIIKPEPTAADALATLTEAQLTKDPAELTLDDVLAKAKAELAVEQEQKAKQEQAIADQEAAVAQRQSDISAALIAKGYIGDGSVADFKILFDKDLAKFQAGAENFFGGKDSQVLAEQYAAVNNGENTLDRLAHLVSMYGG